jgi:chitinase
MNTTPPRNVIYYNDAANPIPLAGISSLAYTDVILGFLLPDGNGGLAGQGYGSTIPGNSGAFDANGNPNPDDITTLQGAGKNVLISLGGSTCSTGDWQQFASDVSGLVQQVADYVINNKLNGVDIDYEDDNGFTGVYDGVQFLIDLTNGLAQALPPGQNIITHAPQPPYFDPAGGYNPPGGTAPYTQIWQAAGNNITWFNCQFYQNSSYDEPASTKASWYNAFVTTQGVPAPKLLVGTPLAAAAANAPAYDPLDQFTSQVIGPLRQEYPGAFGGAMGWEFFYDPDGTWADGVGLALHQQHVFYWGTDGNVHHAYWDPASGQVSHDVWTSDGSVAGDVATLLGGGGAAGPQQHVFYRGTDNNVHHAYWDPASGQVSHDVWTSDGSVADDVATLLANGQQHVFYAGLDNNVHHVYWDPTTGMNADQWTSDGQAAGTVATLLGGGTAGPQQHVFYRGFDYNVYHAYWDPSGDGQVNHDQWTKDGSVFGNLQALLAGAQQHVFCLGRDENVHHIYWDPATGVNAETWTSDGQINSLTTLLTG